MEKRRSSEKAESFWGAIGDTGVGSSGISNRATQLDHLPSSAFENSRYRMNRGAHAVDGARVNQNVVPYAQNNLEDSNNLFADLNPFQINGTGKAPLYNKPLENKVDELQRPRNNLASYTKNIRAHNEVPKRRSMIIWMVLFQELIVNLMVIIRHLQLLPAPLYLNISIMVDSNRLHNQICLSISKVAL